MNYVIKFKPQNSDWLSINCSGKDEAVILQMLLPIIKMKKIGAILEYEIEEV